MLLCEACSNEHKANPRTKMHMMQSLNKVADPEQARMASYFEDLVQDSDYVFDPARYSAPINFTHYSFAIRQLASAPSDVENSSLRYINPLALSHAEPGEASHCTQGCRCTVPAPARP